MALPDSLKGRYAYHFTSIDNLNSIIENGLLCTNLKNEQNISSSEYCRTWDTRKKKYDVGTVF